MLHSLALGPYDLPQISSSWKILSSSSTTALKIPVDFQQLGNKNILYDSWEQAGNWVHPTTGTAGNNRNNN